MQKPLISFATSAPGGTEANIAGIRTGWNLLLAVLIAWLAQRVGGINVELDSATLWTVVWAVGAAWYRVTRVVADRWPNPWAALFFGIASPPQYDPEQS